MFDSENTERFVDPNTDNLDDFNSLMYGDAKEQTEEVKEPKKDDAVTPEDENALADDDDNVEDVSTDTDDDEDDGSQDAPKEKPLSRTQKRIRDLNTQKHEAIRERDDYARKYAELAARIDQIEGKSVKPAPEAVQTDTKTEGPGPDDKDAKGDLLYPLGEYDPKFIADRTRYEFTQLQAEAEVTRKRDAEAAARMSEQTALETEWQEKLNTSIENKYPDFLERNMELSDTLSDLNPEYGQYLANTIMSMEYGTDVLYHLASNLEEAKNIASMSPGKATLALGRLEAAFATNGDEPRGTKPKVSNAPAPPPVNKGSSTKMSVRPDTDDLDAFEREFYKRAK